MAAGQYSAGTIFLQVVPVFRDTMDRIQDESRKLSRAIGDDLEKSGRDGGQRASRAYSEEMEKGARDSGDKAGKAYAGAFESNIKKSITNAQREMDRLDFSTASQKTLDDLDRVKRKLRELKDVDFSVDFDSKKVLADVAILEATLKKMASGDHEINITANVQKALAEIRAIQTAAEKVEKKRREIRFEGRVDFKPAERQIGVFEKKFRASMRSAAESLGDHLGPEIAKARAELESLADVEIGIDMDADQALATAAAVKAELQRLAAQNANIDLELDAGAAIAQLEAVERKIKSVERETGAFETKFRAAMRSAANSIGNGMGDEVAKIKAELSALSDLRIGVDIDAEDALAKARGLKTAMEFIAGQDVDVDVDIDLGAAIAQIAYLDHSLEKLSRQAVRTTSTVGIMGALMMALRGPMSSSGGGAENTANAFRSFNFVILAVITLLPALVPMLAAVGGGLLALIPILGALGAGLGVAIIGFSGLGGALREMGNVADTQAQAAGKAEQSAKQVAAATHAVADAERALADARRNAARAAADAERAVADARRNASRAIEAAYDRQKDAADAYKDAQDAVRQAEEDLRQAREDAAADAADLATKQRKNAVDERQAVLDLGAAQNEYNAVMADGSSTNTDKEQASVNLEQAQIALNDVRNEQVELSKEAEDYAKNGVDGSEKVKSAQEQLTDALEAQKDAQNAVKDAAEDTRRVQMDAARDVADALRNQKRVAADNARSIEDAQRALSRAQEGAAQAVTDAASESTAAMDRLEVAMAKLSPAGRKFARFLFGLRTGFREVRDEVQQRMLPGIQRGMQALIDEYGPKFKAFAGDVASSLGRIGENTGKGLGSKPWQEFFRTYGKLVPRLIDKFAENSGNWMTAWAGLFTVVAPYAERLADALLKMSERAERFFNSAKGKKEVQEFMDYAFKVGPDVVDFFKDLAIFAKDLAKALAPLGELVIKGFNEFMEWVSSTDPKNLQLLVTGIIGLGVAFMLAAGAIALMAAGSLALSSPVFWITLLVFAVIALYKRFPQVKKVVDVVIKAVVKAFLWLKDVVVDKVLPPVMKMLEALWTAIKFLWEKVVKPVLGFIWDAFKVAFAGIKVVWDTILAPVLQAIWDVISFLWEKVVKPVLGFIGAAFKLYFTMIKGYWKNILYPIFDLFITTIKLLWNEVLKPILKRMGEGWQSFADDVTAVWRDHIKPIFEAIGDFISEHVEPKFRDAVKILKDIWGGLTDAFAVPVRFLINTVVNDGLIAGFNWVARKVGSTEMKPVPVPGWAQEKTSKATGGMLPYDRRTSRAVGGVLPGYNPGRDNFTFYNPSLGELNLSGGEGILRPEVVRAAGGEQWLNGLNHAAMQGGVQGVQKKLYASRWNGGTLPLAGASVTSHGSSYGHPAFDMNYPGRADYGKPVMAWRDGIFAQKNYVGDRSYGRWAILNHANGLQSLYAHLSAFSDAIVGQAIKAGEVLGYVGDLGNTGSPPTSHLHFEIMGGAAEISDADISKFGDIATGKSKMPKWAKGILADPVEWMKSLVSKPLDTMRGKFGDTDLTKLITGVPMELIRRSVKFVKGLIPTKDEAWDAITGAPSKDNIEAPGPEGNFPGELPGGGSSTPTPTSLWKGGVLPYNGTMKYDAGGYLPPGLTSVVNLTGKPEPVFTADQFGDLEIGGTSGDGFTYAPTLVGTKLTPADLIDDMDFARRRIRREGRYGRSKL